MKKGKKVRVIDPKVREYLLEGTIHSRCHMCNALGYEAWFIEVGGTIVHFMRDQLKEIR